MGDKSKSLEGPKVEVSKEEVLKAAEQLDPSDKRAFVHEMMTTVSWQRPTPNPIASKISGTHITDILIVAREHDERTYDLAKQRENRKDSNRGFLLAVFIIVLIAVSLACWGFHDKTEILVPLLSGLFGIGAGGVGGYGLGKSSEK